VFSFRHIQLLAKDRCLLVIHRTDGASEIYMEHLSDLHLAIQHHRYKMLLQKDKIGDEFLLAYDEAKRMLAVFKAQVRCNLLLLRKGLNRYHSCIYLCLMKSF
jgi:hypothetical protein